MTSAIQTHQRKVSAIARALLVLVMSAGGAATGMAMAGETEPLDFEYRVVSHGSGRPAMVFNDGRWTYLLHRSGQSIRAEGAMRSGPYWLIEGVPETLRYEIDGEAVIVQRKGGNHFLARDSATTFDQSHALDSPVPVVSDRLLIHGNYASLGALRATRVTLPLAQMLRALAPKGWQGAADWDVSLNDGVTLRTLDGDNWLQALSRVLAQRDLYAVVDFDRRHIRLRTTPPDGYFLRQTGASPLNAHAVSPARVPRDASFGATSVASPEAGHAESHEAATDASALHEGSPSRETSRRHGSLLATVFGVRAIRDNKSGRIELRFDDVAGGGLAGLANDARTEPTHLVWRDGVGRKLRTKWEPQEKVLSFASVDRFIVASGDRQIEVARVPGIHYGFPAANGAGLERVFEKDGATYLAFSGSKASIRVFDETLQGSTNARRPTTGQRAGEHRDRNYKHYGIARDLTVVADGEVVRVRRTPEVRFSEREVRQP